jgi:Bacterial transcriptional regulator
LRSCRARPAGACAMSLRKPRLDPLPHLTKTNPGKLLERVHEVARRAYEGIGNEPALGEISLAAPVTDHGRMANGAINIPVPTSRWSVERVGPNSRDKCRLPRLPFRRHGWRALGAERLANFQRPRSKRSILPMKCVESGGSVFLAQHGVETGSGLCRRSA